MGCHIRNCSVRIAYYPGALPSVQFVSKILGSLRKPTDINGMCNFDMEITI